MRIFDYYPDLPYITPTRAEVIVGILEKSKPKTCIELGFYHGKSTGLIAEVLEKNGVGHLYTFDFPTALKHTPNVNDILKTLGLEHRVTVLTDPGGFHWSLLDLLEQKPRPRFDFAYIDGAHTWVGTGYSLLLLERMLNPGAWLVIDDLNWTVEAANQRREVSGKRLLLPKASRRERETKGVRKVFELLCTDDKYSDKEELLGGNYGVCRFRG